MQDERKRYILSRLRETGEVSVNTLAERFDVSGMTIRRDLAELGNSGLLQRVHGGAVSRPAPSIRSGTLAEEKQRIGQEVARLVGPGQTVFIDSGSTCQAVATELAKEEGLLAITNSLHVALEFQYSESQLVVLGGQLTSDASLVNGRVFDGRVSTRVDTLVLGCGGVAEDGISYFDLAETDLRHQVIEQSGKVILVADHTKFGTKRAISLGPLEILDAVVTDREPEAFMAVAFAEAKVRVVVV